MRLDTRGQVGITVDDRGRDVHHRLRRWRRQPFGHLGLAGAGAAQDERDHDVSSGDIGVERS